MPTIESQSTAVSLDSLLSELGYRQSPFYRESTDYADSPAAHLLRDAQRATVRGTYFIRTMGGDVVSSRYRPAVHVAEASTPEAARAIHRHLWNQGTTPFLLVSLPGQVRVYTPFAYDESDESVGQVGRPLDLARGLPDIAETLHFLRAESIDSGDIWRQTGKYLLKEKRVDRALLGALRTLSDRLVNEHALMRAVAHALVGRFVYLYYLRERKILSNEWLATKNVDPDAVFSPNVRLEAFRRLTDAVDERFNGHIFPIDWSASTAPSAAAVASAGRAFTGTDVSSGQGTLFSPFDFSYIPIELLSAIYEQFLHDSGHGAEQGAFYTSESVADYLLAEVESVKPLQRGMKVLDPCCGSGIFLVLSFRRLVEQEMRHRGGGQLAPEELSGILTASIFGVERNSEACLVAEFSLILALLSYIDPPALHLLPLFKFPTLHNSQIIESDFFSSDSPFWRDRQKFDWIIGNPPWLELDPESSDEVPALLWINHNRRETPVARFRISEAFTWRVREKLAAAGVAGLITPATSLTNDHSAKYRKAFFTKNLIHRVTNFSNLAYTLFESADEPAANLIYSVNADGESKPDIIHFGPLLVNQLATVPDQSRRRKAPWVLTVSESEIQTISAADAERGDATTWKRALWGTPRDGRALQRLRRLLPTTLESIVEERGWALNLGLQLRADSGTEKHPNQDVATIRLEAGATDAEAVTYARWFAGLKVLQPKNLRNAVSRLTIPSHWLADNSWGTFIRERRTEGLKILPAPHLFLWNEYAAFSKQDFIFRHPQVGLAAPADDADWLKAVSVIWSSSITRYFLFLDLSASWGISRSTIDLKDARRMPMPRFDSVMVAQLASVHDEFAAAETAAESDVLWDRATWQRDMDRRIASILSIPSALMLLAQELTEFRLPLVKGKAPRNLTRAPDRQQLVKYAGRLKAELDGFIERRSRRHAVVVRESVAGIVASVEITENGRATASVIDADRTEQATVRGILRAAAQQFGQWAYVQRSVRVFSGRTIHICKPPRRLEWTETQALLDATDIIAEVTELRGGHE